MQKNPKDIGCLTLNVSYVPTAILSWRAAISLLYQDHAHAIDAVDFTRYTYDDWVAFSQTPAGEKYPHVHTSKFRVCVPEIIVLTRYNSLKQNEVRYSRQTIFERDGHICIYCNKKFPRNKLNIEHILPRSRGGKSNFTNTATCCYSCNSKKGDKTVAESGMKLMYQPKKPKWISPLTKREGHDHLPSWEHFLDRVNVDVGDARQ